MPAGPERRGCRHEKYCKNALLERDHLGSGFRPVVFRPVPTRLFQCGLAVHRLRHPVCRARRGRQSPVTLKCIKCGDGSLSHPWDKEPSPFQLLKVPEHGTVPASRPLSLSKGSNHQSKGSNYLSKGRNYLLKGLAPPATVAELRIFILGSR